MSNIENITNIIVQTVNPDRVYLFGSYANGTPDSDSDYDFYVVVPDGSERTALITEKLYMALYKKTNKKPIDILVKHTSYFESRKFLPTIEREVFRNGIMLYGNN